MKQLDENGPHVRAGDMDATDRISPRRQRALHEGMQRRLDGYKALVAAVSCRSTPSAVGYASTLFTAATAGREPTVFRHVTGKVHATRSPTYSEHTRSDAER